MIGERPEAEPALDGAAAAALLAAAIGVFALGLVTSLAAAIEGFKEWLKWDEAVGPLSGKSSLGLIAWLAVWPPLHLSLYRRDGLLLGTAVVAAILIIAGLVLMFPPIFERLEP